MMVTAKKRRGRGRARGRRREAGDGEALATPPAKVAKGKKPPSAKGATEKPVTAPSLSARGEELSACQLHRAGPGGQHVLTP